MGRPAGHRRDRSGNAHPGRRDLPPADGRGVPAARPRRLLGAPCRRRRRPGLRRRQLRRSAGARPERRHPHRDRLVRARRHRGPDEHDPRQGLRDGGRRRTRTGPGGHHRRPLRSVRAAGGDRPL